jgi:two-component system, cell cycle sensor histidine kinase and response regulator CckA
VLDFLRWLFSTGDFMPHGHCYMWNPGLVRLHAISDLFIGGSYVAISATLTYLVRRSRRDIPFSWMFLAFGIFIVACGCTHLVEIWTLWTPVYWFAGFVKLITATASVATAIALPPLIPQTLKLIRAAKVSEHRHQQLQTAYADLEREIADRKRIEQELSQSEERFRSLFQNLRVGVTVSGPNGELLMCNPAAMQLLGMTEEQLATGAISGREASHESSSEPMQQISGVINSRRPVRDAIMAVQRAHDDEVWLLMSSEPQLADGAVSTVISTCVDITQRKLAEDTIVEWKNRYEAAIQASGQVLYDWNPATEEVTFSGSVAKTLGYEAEEMAGGLTHLVERIHPDDQQRFTAEMDRVTATGESIHLRFQMQRKDGSYITIQDDGYFFMDPGNRVFRMVGFLSDVSEMIELEEQLRQAQKMEAIGQLAGGIAHDFNNILTVIWGYSDTLSEDLEPGSPLRQDAEEIALAAQRARGLTRQLLAFSRRQVLDLQPLDLNVVLAKLEPMLHRLLGDDIHLHIVPASKGLVRADRVQTELVILNLAINARDAMPVGGVLTIQTGNARLDPANEGWQAAATPGSYVMLVVSDTGSGMDARTKAHLFEPFFTTKEFGKGTGMGLSTVYGIIRQSGGYIRVESEPAQGAVFKTYWPQIEGSMEAERTEDASMILGGSETILIVEDESAVRKLMCKTLRKAGYKILEAADGLQALSLCERYGEAIHLVVTDVIMPGISGPELVKSLGSLHPESKTMFISGYTRAFKPMTAGVQPAPFLAKPFTPRSLALKVREVLTLESPAERQLPVETGDATRDR